MLEVYGDNYVEADWFLGLSPTLSVSAVRMLGPRGSNPPRVDDLLVYDRPDIILVRDGRPVLVVEKTREVPTGHNVGQRVARLVRSVERRIPTVKFFPFDAKKHGAYAGLCNLNIRLLDAFDRMSAIHDVPMLAVNWPADSDGELFVGLDENVEMSLLVQSFVDAGMKRWWPHARQLLTSMRSEYKRRLGIRPQYGTPPPSVEILRTRDFVSGAQVTTGDAAPLKQLLNREETLVYTIAMTPEKCRREDPYTGTQFIYDYSWCRTGVSPEEKSRNLVLQFPAIPRRIWEKANPNDALRKSSNWYLTANALVFADGVEVLRLSR